jgi:NAD(P)-dependent dehydrogenase (short-subunit alcohol dehydrogenase family)
VLAFRDVVARWRKHVNLLFNNAGIAQGYSFVTGERADWDKTFNVCWFGVYYNTRAFLELLIAAPVAHIINTSSINGFWASIGPARSHTAYSAAKFAVKGFTEALMTDLRINAPHVHASVVMPGHIGTSIILNANKIFGREPKEMDAEQLVLERERLTKFGLDVSAASDEDLRVGLQALAEGFRDLAPMTAKDATAVILEAVRHDKWRILVGEDAKILDEMVRQDPQGAYSIDFFDKLNERGILGGLTGGLAAQPPATP